MVCLHLPSQTHTNSEVNVGFRGIGLDLSVPSRPSPCFPERRILIPSESQIPNQEVVKIMWGKIARAFQSANLDSDPASNIYQLGHLGDVTSPYSLPLICEALIISTSKGCCDNCRGSLAWDGCSRNKNTKQKKKNKNHSQTALIPPSSPVPVGSSKTFVSTSFPSEGLPILT